MGFLAPLLPKSNCLKNELNFLTGLNFNRKGIKLVYRNQQGGKKYDSVQKS